MVGKLTNLFKTLRNKNKLILNGYQNFVRFLNWLQEDSKLVIQKSDKIKNTFLY